MCSRYLKPYLLLLLLVPLCSVADDCLDIFPSATNGNTSFALTPLVSNGTNDIDAGNNASLSLAAGQNHDYDSIEARNDFTLTVTGSGTARLHLQGDLELRNDAQINAGGNPEDLVIYLNGNLTIRNNATINAIIWANGNIDINNNGTTNGALSANGNIILGSHSVAYDSAAIDNADFAGMCSQAAGSSTPAAEWRFDEAQWTGATGEVLDNSGNGFDSQSFNGPTKAEDNPAIAGNPGTCGYGIFDGSNDYVELPAAFPNLTNSFTITGWINANDLGNDQRIFVDDESNSGGFAFSLGDGGNGKLRFFSRSVSPVVVDTQNAVITANSWYFVAAVHDAVAKTRQIYVNGTAVTLNTGSAVSTYTGTWGADNGKASIAGETDNAGGEGTSNWRFNGLLDEMRVYQAALSSNEITAVMNETHTCQATQTASNRLILSTTNNASLGGISFADQDLVDYTPSDDTAVIFALGDTIFDGGSDVKAFHLMDDGNYILSANDDESINGVNFENEDLIEYNPTTGAATLFLDGDAVFSGEENIDAAHVLDNGHILLSTSGGAAIGGLSFDDEDIVEYDPSNGTASLFFDGSVLFSGGTDIKSIHILDNGNLVLSTSSGNVTLGGLTFSKDDLAEYNRGTDTATLFFDGGNFSNNEEIDAVHVIEPSGTTSLDHYSITAASSAVSCEPLNVVIQAHDASDNLFTLSGDTVINLSTSTNRGDWSGQGIANGAANDGAATLTISAGTSGVDSDNPIQLRHGDLNGGTSEVVNINVSDGSKSESAAEDPDITFSLSGLRFVDNTNANIIPTQVAGVDSVDLFVQAIQVDADAADPSTAACVSLYPSGQNITMQMAGECKNPSSCVLSQMTVNGGNIGLADDNIGAGAVESSYADVSLTFGGGALAPVTINYGDVGLIQLHVRHQAEFLSGSSNDFVVRPHHFAVTTVEDGAGNANPGTTMTSAGGNGFMTSGTAFRLLVEARNAAGNITSNYGNEAVPEGVTVASVPTLVHPTSGSAGTLSNSSAFTATSTGGEFENTTIGWSEVGTITVQPDVADSDYLGTGSGAYAPENSVSIGRFFPAAFRVSAITTASPTCGGFTYLSEPGITLGYSLFAVNASGGLVTNYHYDSGGAGYSDQVSHMGVVTYHAEDANDGNDRSSRFSDGVSAGWSSGSYSVASSTAQFDRFNSTLVDGPFNSLQLSVSVADPDGAVLDVSHVNQDPTNSGADYSAAIGYNGTAFTPLILRYGRVVIESASGPETAALPVIFGSQQWNGVDFEDATTDSCSRIAFSDITFDTINPITDPQSVDVGSSTTNGDFNSSGVQAETAGGTFGLSFSAPNDRGAFLVSVDLTNYPWLRFDWNKDGDNSNDFSLPDATISFGSYRGHDRVIYWRERF